MPKPHPKELALLKAIASAPDDDLPRLVYADWLEERGREERARFIRLQIGEHTADSWAGRSECRSAAAVLLDEHHQGWFKELPKWARAWYGGRPWCRPDFTRGFIERVNVYASPFLKFGNQLLDRAPVVELRVHEVTRLTAYLARCPWLGRVSRVRLNSEELGVAGAAALARNRHLGGVRELELAGCSLGDAGVRELAEAKSLTGLWRLDLSGNRLTVAAAKALRQTRFTPGLTHLDLSDNP
jgi:uncharacterized protein (TIGR02996 family)